MKQQQINFVGQMTVNWSFKVIIKNNVPVKAL